LDDNSREEVATVSARELLKCCTKVLGCRLEFRTGLTTVVPNHDAASVCAVGNGTLVLVECLESLLANVGFFWRIVFEMRLCLVETVLCSVFIADDGFSLLDVLACSVIRGCKMAIEDSRRSLDRTNRQFWEISELPELVEATKPPSLPVHPATTSDTE
jgi:hypothetical protein